MINEKEFEQLKLMVRTLGEALIERTELDNQRFAKLSQALQELQENMMVDDGVSRKTANFISKVSADQFAALFQNEVTLDSLASAILNRAQNALVYKAQTSKNRAPQLLVLDHYFPTAMRAQLSETGQLTVWHQLEGSVGEQEGWEVDRRFTEDPAFKAPIQELLASYGVAADTYVYLIDDINLQERREQLSAQALDNFAKEYGVDEKSIAAEEARLLAEQGNPLPTEQDFADFPEPIVPVAEEAPQPAPAPVELEPEPAQGSALERLKQQLATLH